MTKRKQEAARVRLLCAYVGEGQTHMRGAVIELDAAEAERLIELGAAEAVTE